MKHRVTACAVLAATILAAPAAAQTLADVARQEEARRTSAATPKAKKSYSNADLGPGAVRDEAPAGETKDCYESKSTGKCLSADEMLKNSAEQQAKFEIAPLEPHWRNHADTIRDALETAHAELAAVEPAADNDTRSPGERANAAKLLTKFQSKVRRLEGDWLALEAEAKKQKIPMKWLDPAPELKLLTRTAQ